jgi:hypothetical protein
MFRAISPIIRSVELYYSVWYSAPINTNKAASLHLVGFLLIIGIIYKMHGKTNLKFKKLVGTMDWIYLTQDMDRWRARVNTVI